jgi:hypothetical protein
MLYVANARHFLAIVSIDLFPDNTCQSLCVVLELYLLIFHIWVEVLKSSTVHFTVQSKTCKK